MLERDILRSCKHRLDYYQSVGVVVHHDRLNSGKMQIEGRYVQLCASGTPDIVAYIRIVDICYVLFIECKRDAKAVWREDQRNFARKFTSFNNVVYLLVYDPRELDKTIEILTGYTQTVINSIKEPGI